MRVKFKRAYIGVKSGVANPYGLWDWVGKAPCMGPMSPVRAHSLWAGLCPEKAGKAGKI